MAWDTVFERLLTPVLDGPAESREQRMREAIEAANIGKTTSGTLYEKPYVHIMDEARRLAVSVKFDPNAGTLATSYAFGRSATLDAWGRKVLKSLPVAHPHQ